MTILITGGAGYIGTALCYELQKREDIDRVLIYDNMSRQNYNLMIGNTKLDKRFEFIEGDILDSRNLHKAVKQSDVVYHLAAKVTTPFADQQAHLFEQVNHWGTAELTYAIEESQVDKLIYLSSVSVYGSGDIEKNTEAEKEPKTFYGISKLRGEEHVNRLSSQLSTYTLRCGNVYGYNKSMRFDAVINKFMFEANFHNKININGTGQQHRPFIYIESVGKSLASILDGEIAAGTHNLIEHNLEIMEIVEVIKNIYPELETIFINHNMKLRELRVDTQKGNASTPKDIEILKERLLAFKQAFAF